MSQVQPPTSWSPPNLKRKTYQNLQKVAFPCAWHVQCMYMVIVYNAMLLWMSVNVFLVVGIWKNYRCKKDVLKPFLWWEMLKVKKRTDCVFKSSLFLFLSVSLSFSFSLSLSAFMSGLYSFPILFSKNFAKQICIYFKHVHLFYFLCLADFALGHWGKVMYDIMHSWCYCNDL